VVLSSPFTVLWAGREIPAVDGYEIGWIYRQIISFRHTQIQYK